MKKLRMLLTLMLVSVCSWQSAWAQEEIAVTVSLPANNALYTEIMANPNVSDAKTVTSLTVTGKLGGDNDWATLKTMEALKTLDLSGADCEAVPDDQFYNCCQNLEIVILPSNLKAIGKRAFYNSSLKSVTAPSTLQAIGDEAFRNCYNLVTCSLEDCAITAIPDYCFENCTSLESFTIPETVTSIGIYAFAGCELFSSALPSNLTNIGDYAFNQAAMTDIDVVIPDGMTVENGIFRYTEIKSIVFPNNYYECNDCIQGCSNLTDITFRSATVVKSYGEPENISDITLHVPDYLMSMYSINVDWSQYKAVVAITEPITDYVIQTDLELSSSMRMANTPNVIFKLPDYDYANLAFKIDGDAAQSFANFITCNDNTSYYTPESDYWTLIMSECSNVTASNYMHKIETLGNQWYFMSLPFDFTVGDIIAEDAKFAIRRYDGERRNTQDEASGNWVNLDSEDVVMAGTGFIYQTNKQTWTTFKAKSGGTNYAFKTSSDEPTIALAANNSNANASAANTGWNMVGNPWQTYYNTHKMNYTAPICYYKNNGGTYEAVSLEDDDYALLPNQAFFVQCPIGVESIGFPASGRQLTSEITEQNGTRAMNATNRKLFDLQISDTEDRKDKTRFVINEEAKSEYEIGRDASKFISDGTQTPQIYTLDADGIQYAINERPANEGMLRLGIVFANDGQFTLSAIRNSLGQVVLTDNETGVKTDLQQNNYSFDAKKGVNEQRFTLSFSRGFGGDDTTSIQSANNQAEAMEVFTLDGQRLGRTTEGLKKGVYVVRQGQQTQKVIIK